MSSKIIVAIVAAVLSLVAPVAVEAQTVSVQQSTLTFGHVEVRFSGLTAGSQYYSTRCMGTASTPSSCACPSSGAWLGPSGGNRTTTYWGHDYVTRSPYYRYELFNSSCFSVGSDSYRVSPPSVTVSDITTTSAKFTVVPKPVPAGVTNTGGIWFYHAYALEPGSGCRIEDSLDGIDDVNSVSGLEPGTTYTYKLLNAGSVCDSGRIINEDRDLVATATFTTLGDSGPPPPQPPTEVEATSDGSGSVTLSWSNPGDPDIASYEYYLQRAGGPAGEWRTVAGSDADTTSVTIDLTTGEAVAGNARGVTPMVEWTIYLRARGVNGAASRATSTVVSTGAGSGTVVPALPLAGLVTLALVLFLGGQRKRKGHS